MPRELIDMEGLASPAVQALKDLQTPAELPFSINKMEVVFEGRRRLGSQVSVEFLDPDGHTLELFWAMDQVGSDARIRPPEEWRQQSSFQGAIANAPPGQDTTLQDPSLLAHFGEARTILS